MRISLLTLLLLTTAATASPALAQSQPDQAEAQETAEPRYQAGARRERPQRGWTGEGARTRPPERIYRPVENTEAPAPAPVRVREIARSPVEPSSQQPSPEPPAAQVARRPARDGGGWNWREREGERRGRNRDIPPAASSPVFGSAIESPRDVTLPRREVSAGSALPPGPGSGAELRGKIAAEGLRRDRIASDNWRREWRQDRRYDWRRHRDRDRSRFHLGFYIDPFGWGYRDWGLGWRLPSRYYSSRYWISDPYHYRLPPVYGYYRWIRYHDDVLLVDLRSGRVVDRIRDFFW